MQKLTVELSIPIPENMVLIEKVEYENLKKNELAGKWWTMKDLQIQTGKKPDWLRQHILYVPRFKRILDTEHGGFVHYPKIKGEVWTFQATKMVEFLEKYFPEFFHA